MRRGAANLEVGTLEGCMRRLTEPGRCLLLEKNLDWLRCRLSTNHENEVTIHKAKDKQSTD
jgi:hypothetical protein